MHKLHFTIHINAPREKVWNTMLEDATYRQWTSIFSPGSRFEGSWDEGSKIVFLGDGEEGKESGMVATIAENRPLEFVSIKHLGMINDGVEDTESEEVKSWVGAREEYTLRDVDGGTDVEIDVDTTEEYEEDFGEMWPKALQRLKELAEQ
jgi:uncharacterized protein YndB with AHSA1/START domain